jgi:cytochrome bd-type quinol oxidase subunit 2
MTEEPGRGNRSPVQGGELISGLSAVLLLGLMFGVKWFGVAGVPGASATRAATTTAVNAWNAMSIVRWLMLVTIVVTVGAVVLHLRQRTHGHPTDSGLAITVLGTATAALLTWRVLIQLPRPDQIIDQKFGGVIGLIAALGIAFGGFERLREERRRTRRAEQKTSQNPGLANRVTAR